MKLQGLFSDSVVSRVSDQAERLIENGIAGVFMVLLLWMLAGGLLRGRTDEEWYHNN